MKILFTHPGKIGDLLYSLPAMLAFKAASKASISLQIAPMSIPLLPLLEAQEVFDALIVDSNFRPLHENRGIQPWRMHEPEGFSEIIHLGFRESSNFNEHEQHLIEHAFYVLSNDYGYNLPLEISSPYLRVPALPQQSPYVVFHGFGETLDRVLHPSQQEALMKTWLSVLSNLNYPIVVVTGQREAARYRGDKWQIIIPKNFLETAQLIAGATMFLGNQSAPAAIANGLKVPRAICAVFRNALPTGARGLAFAPDVAPELILKAIQDSFGLQLSNKSE